MASTRLGCSGWWAILCSAQWGCVTNNVRLLLSPRRARIVLLFFCPVVRRSRRRLLQASLTRRFAQLRRVVTGAFSGVWAAGFAQSWAFGGLTEHLLNWQSALHCALLQASCRFSHVLCMQGVCLAKSVLLVGGVWQRFDRRDWHCHSSGRLARAHEKRPGTTP